MKDYVVRISGLRKHAELNGKLGKVVGAVRDSQGGWRGRVSVADGGTQPLEDESHLPTRNLKLKNLKLQPEAPSTGAEHKVEMRATRRCGRGIFATEDLSRGELVFVGSASSLRRNVRDQWICNFNHSCSPNTFSYLHLAGAEEYSFCLRDIKSGEELTRAYKARTHTRTPAHTPPRCGGVCASVGSGLQGRVGAGVVAGW